MGCVNRKIVDEARPIMPRETDLVRACLAYLATRRAFAWRNNTGACRWEDRRGRSHVLRFGRVGSSDIIGLLPDGRFLAVECKVGKNTCTPAQTRFLAEVRRKGGLAIVARSVTDLQLALDQKD